MTPKSLLAAVLLGATALAGPIACKMAGTDSAVVTPGTEAGIDLAAMDKTVKPGDDFNAYANGTWQKTTEIPADRSDTGAHYVAFQNTERQQNELLAGILKGSPAAGSNEAKIKDYYNAYMNQAGIDAAEDRPSKYERQIHRVPPVARKPTPDYYFAASPSPHITRLS